MNENGTKEYPVESVSEFLKVLFNKWGTLAYNYLYFRGEAEDYKDTACCPWLYRKKKLLKKERYFYNESLRCFPEKFTDVNDALTRLTLLQHYDFPTRLLDVTKSPLIALYFATLKPNVKVGVVHAIETPTECVHYSDNDDVKAIAELAGKDAKDLLKREKQHLYPLFVKPLWRNERIRAQQGAMLIFDGDREDTPNRAFLQKKAEKTIHVLSLNFLLRIKEKYSLNSRN